MTQMNLVFKLPIFLSYNPSLLSNLIRAPFHTYIQKENETGRKQKSSQIITISTVSRIPITTWKIVFQKNDRIIDIFLVTKEFMAILRVQISYEMPP